MRINRLIPLLFLLVLLFFNAKYPLEKEMVKLTRSSVSSITPHLLPTPTEEKAIVTRVIDGDTIDVFINDKKDTVRFIGINSPEIHDPRMPVQCFGKEASERAQALLSGKNILLRNDVSQSNRDKYQRLLRYVFLLDGTNINKKMIEDGYAHEYTYASNPYFFQKEFIEAEKGARENKKGLWADGVCIK